jgi:hypothetical protein
MILRPRVGVAQGADQTPVLSHGRKTVQTQAPARRGSGGAGGKPGNNASISSQHVDGKPHQVIGRRKRHYIRHQQQVTLGGVSLGIRCAVLTPQAAPSEQRAEQVQRMLPGNQRTLRCADKTQERVGRRVCGGMRPCIAHTSC